MKSVADASGEIAFSISSACRAVLLAWAFGALLQAQVPTGEIRLTVEDPDGMAMQASGKLDARAFQTDALGRYTFERLSPGRHRLEISKPGFATQMVPIDVAAGTPVVRIVKLDLASASSRIEVVDTTPLAGVDLAKDQIASPIQTATADDIANSGGLDLSDFMNRRLNGV